MVDAVFRLFPWDVEGDQDAVGRLRDAGVARVSLAASYHAARVATPRHPRHRVLELPTSAVHAEWPSSGGRVLPQGIGRFERARDALEAGGIAVDAWLVVNHLDGAAPGVPRVRSPFGDELGHAPCLARPETLAFDDALLGALLPLAAGRSVLLEALGWLGVSHGSQHDKLAGAEFGRVAEEVLGTCVCPRCLDAAGASARDVVALRRLVDADPGGSGHDGMESLERMRAGRRRSLAAVRDRALGLAARAGVAEVLLSDTDADLDARVAFDGSAPGSAAVGGAGAGGSGGEGAGASSGSAVEPGWAGADGGVREAVLVGCWGDQADGARRIRETVAAHPSARVVAYVEMLGRDTERLADDWAELIAAGASGLHVYHAGLASTRRLRAAGEAAASLAT